MSLFSMKITELPKIGPKTATLYERLGVHSVGELIRMYPRTYEDLSNPVSISEAQSCLLYTSPSPRDGLLSRMPSSA